MSRTSERITLHSIVCECVFHAPGRKNGTFQYKLFMTYVFHVLLRVFSFSIYRSPSLTFLPALSWSFSVPLRFECCVVSRTICVVFLNKRKKYFEPIFFPSSSLLFGILVFFYCYLVQSCLNVQHSHTASLVVHGQWGAWHLSFCIVCYFIFGMLGFAICYSINNNNKTIYACGSEQQQQVVKHFKWTTHSLKAYRR